MIELRGNVRFCVVVVGFSGRGAGEVVLFEVDIFLDARIPISFYLIVHASRKL